MKAIRIADYGNSEQMKLEEVERPTLRDGEILVTVHAAGVNPIDWKIREGRRKDTFPSHFPLTLGQDFSGVIAEVSAGGSEFKVGNAVFGFGHGSYAELTVTRTQSIARKPDSIPFETAAAIPTPGLMAWQLIEAAQVKNGSRVLIHGGAGGVGSFAVQIAKWKGAHVTATASKEDLSYLQSIGADQWIDFKSQRFETLLKDMDVVIDLIGGEVQTRSFSVLKKGGIILTTVGGINGEETARLGIRGINLMMKREAAGLSKLAGLVEEGIIKPRVSQILLLAEARKAHDLNQSGQSHGKIILKVA